ncbi:helix-turn-helix domain-containing protein [Telluribacter sp. SYSU D00476]|uniref:helix-turn-helix domain-containing protein n=1 Tax=Telluribacter sp. SYSU D00476 TaxID=2811430 RepID=UPI001FF2F239|nr:helix-turn-helix domain-containing protein [Telluribacter sp. SYSU D00476]
MIVFDYRLPSPGLREYVRLFQIVGFEFAASETAPWKPYWPRPENCLSFYPRKTEIIEFADGHQEERRHRASVMGQPCVITNRQPSNNFMMFQIVFQPGALFRLTGVPANLLTNQFFDAEAIFSSEINLVNERLSSTGNYLEMVEIVEQFLWYLIRKEKYDVRPVDKVGMYLISSPKPVSMDWLARQACLSRKQFYRKFVERMGVSPKFYSRIVQFDNAVKMKNAHPEKDWLSIALDLGYYDYQHLVRDFREFTHLTPSAFYQQDSKAPERKYGFKEV